MCNKFDRSHGVIGFRLTNSFSKTTIYLQSILKYLFDFINSIVHYLYNYIKPIYDNIAGVLNY